MNAESRTPSPATDNSSGGISEFAATTAAERSAETTSGTASGEPPCSVSREIPWLTALNRALPSTPGSTTRTSRVGSSIR